MQLSLYHQTHNTEAQLSTMPLANQDQQASNVPCGNVTEIILSKDKAESVQMLLPMLTFLNQEKRWLAWIDPPTTLVKKWRERFGERDIESNIMVLRSREGINALELSKRALEAGTCHAVVTWTDQLSSSGFSSLEQSSHQGNSHSIVLRYR